MEAIKRLVFVCTGNTCRSPMAAALARREAEKRRLSVEIDSCGTGARPGDRATDHAVKACADVKLDISHHSAKNISDLTDDGDTVYVVMTRQHEAWLRYVLGLPGERVIVLGSGIPDPYGGSLETYRYTLGCLRDSIKALFDRVEDNIAAIGADGSRPEEAVFEYDIYKAEGEHAPAISMLENHTFTDAWSLALLSDEIDNEDAIFLIASDKCADPSVVDKKSQRVYGYAIAIITADTAQLLKLCVDEHVRRHGVAEALLHSIMNQAVDRGCVEITLEARVSNAPAIALYEKAGFKSLGVRPGFYSTPKEDALIMTASLVEPEEPAAPEPPAPAVHESPEEYEPSDYSGADYEAADYDPSYVPVSGSPAVFAHGGAPGYNGAAEDEFEKYTGADDDNIDDTGEPEVYDAPADDNIENTGEPEGYDAPADDNIDNIGGPEEYAAPADDNTDDIDEPEEDAGTLPQVPVQEPDGAPAHDTGADDQDYDEDDDRLPMIFPDQDDYE